MPEETETQVTEDKLSRRFEAYLILHWKNGQMRLGKRKPSDLSPYEIPIKIDLKILMPKTHEIVAKGEIEMSVTKAEDIIIEGV